MLPVFVIPSVYLLLSYWWLWKRKWAGPWGRTGDFAAFTIRQAAGFVNLYIWMAVIGRGDSLNYIHDADLIYGTLWQNPSHFLHLTFGWGPDNVYPEHLRYISDPLKYSWNNIEYTMVRLNTILYVFTFGNPWGNLVILNAFTFAASHKAYRVLRSLSERVTNLSYLLIFFFPSLIFWTSGLLKEGPVFLCTLLLMVSVLDAESTRFRLRHLLWVAASLFGLLFFRDFFALVWLLLLPLWWLSHRFKLPGWKVFLGSGVLALTGLLVADHYSYAFTISEIICEAQQFFILYEPDPDYTYYVFTGYELLEPLYKLPYAVNNIFWRPNVLHSNDPFRLYTSIELMLVWFILALVWIRRFRQSRPASFWYFLTFSALVLLMFGYVVTDADTMSRYRTIPIFILLLTTIWPQKTSKNNSL